MGVSGSLCVFRCSDESPCVTCRDLQRRYAVDSATPRRSGGGPELDPPFYSSYTAGATPAAVGKAHACPKSPHVVPQAPIAREARLVAYALTPSTTRATLRQLRCRGAAARRDASSSR